MSVRPRRQAADRFVPPSAPGDRGNAIFPSHSILDSVCASLNGRQPDCKRFRKIFIRMFLCIPSRQMADVVSREWSGPVILPIRSPKRPKQLFPLRRVVKLIGIGESVPGFVPQIHHDFACIFQIMRRFFQLRQRCVCQVERDPNNRLSRRASPLVREVTRRMKFRKPLGIELAIKLFNVALYR